MHTRSASPVVVLIIDDVPASLEGFRGALAKPGLEILTARNAEEGVAICLDRRPDIVLIAPQPGDSLALERIAETHGAVRAIRLPSHHPPRKATI